MADKAISELTLLDETPAANDVVAIVDTSEDETKKITPANLHGGYVTDGELTTHEADTSTHGVSEIDGTTERDAAIAVHAALDTGTHGVGASTVESATGSQAKVDTHAADTSTHGVSEVDGTTERDAAIAVHDALTTGTHGVGASTVESTAGSQSKVDTHAADTSTHGVSEVDGVAERDSAISSHASDTSTHGVSEVDGVTERNAAIGSHSADTTSVHGITDTSDLGLLSGNVNQFADITSAGADIEDAVTKKHAEAHPIASHSDTTATGPELDELSDGSETTLHSHAEGGTTDDYSDISANDAATDVTGAELEELTDGSETTKHTHADQGTTDDYSGISANDAATDVTGAQLEELTDASETTLHSHAEGGTTDDHADISANDAATDVTGAQLETLSDGSNADSLHTHNKLKIANKAITIEDPDATEDLTMFFTDDAITVNQIAAVLTGSSTPSVTYTIRHGTDRSAAGAEVVTSGSTVTSVSTGDIVISFNDATIVADSWVWLETTAQSGTVTSMNVTVRYTVD